MKKYVLGAAALSMLLALAGCSSSDDTSKKSSSQSSTEQTSQTTESQSTVHDGPDYTAFKDAFTNKGFTIKDETQEGNILRFTASNENGDVQVKAEKFASPEDTLTVYYAETELLSTEGYQIVNAWTDDRGELSEMNNTVNNVYALVGAQKETCEVYTLQNLMEANYDTCKSILQELGCPLE